MDIRTNFFAPVFYAGIYFFASIGCSDHEDTEPWDLEDPKVESVDFPMIQGKYHAEWEILEDGCEPSLASIMEQWDEWPPPTMGLVVSTGGEATDYLPAMWVHHYLMRHFGRGAFGETILEEDYSPKEETLFEYIYPPDSELYDCPIGYDAYDANFQSEIKGVAIEEGMFSMTFRTTWQDYDDCDESTLEIRNEWIPTEVCTEAHRVTLTLQEPCEPVEECRIVVKHSSRHASTEDERAPLEVREIECACD